MKLIDVTAAYLEILHVTDNQYPLYAQYDTEFCTDYVDLFGENKCHEEGIPGVIHEVCLYISNRVTV